MRNKRLADIAERVLKQLIEIAWSRNS